MVTTTTATNLQEWLRQGEGLYNALVKEYGDLERQIQEINARRATKAGEINQVARLLGKEPVDGSPRRVDVEILSANGNDRLDDEGMPLPGGAELITPANFSSPAAANASIARALSGKFSNGPQPGASSASPTHAAPKMIDAVPLRRS